MTRMRWIGSTCIVGLCLAGGVFFSRHSRARQPIDTLEDAAGRPLALELARVQGQLAALEAKVTTAPPRVAEGAAPSAQQARRPTDEPRAAPVIRRREEATAQFESYFATLDVLRGRSEDRDLTGQFSAALQNPSPEFKSLRAGKVDVVTCGGGLCRVELTFPTENDLNGARHELQFQLGQLSTSGTMFADVSQIRLLAYFAKPGAQLPAFPTN